MSDLIERLRAALDEDERVALRAAADSPDWTYDRETFTVSSARYLVAGRKDAGSPLNDVDGEHIARQDPKRTLDMVFAHRSILDAYKAVLDFYDRNRSLPAGEVTGLRTAVHALAKGYGIEEWDRD